MAREWIEADPLRKKWWGRKCPNIRGDPEDHLVSFSLAPNDALRVLKVWCWSCGTLEEASA